MKQIVILGAKPNPRIPTGDAIYCANAAALSNAEAVAAIPDRRVVASVGVIAKGMKVANSRNPIFKLKTEAICGFDGREAILLTSKNDERLPAVRDALLRDGPIGRALKILDVEEVRKLVLQLFGTYPILNRLSCQQSLVTLALDAMRLTRCYLNWGLGDGMRDVPAKYRPSTGILSLLLAIRDHGPEARYVIAGIGLQDRNRYVFNGKPFQTKEAPRGSLPKHSVADEIVLRQLASRWNICTTEQELVDLLPTLPQ
jgi:hypothetical protein